MTAAGRLLAFVAVLGVGFGAAYAVGAYAGPSTGRTATAEPTGHSESAMQMPTATEEGAKAGELPGLSISRDGYTLVPRSTTLTAGSAVPFSFVVDGPDGTPVTRYQPTHEKDLHLILVRRDLSGYRHVHPILDADGTWSVPLEIRDAGSYRVFADFTPAGAHDGLTLGADLAVAGDFAPRPLPAPATATAVDGYQVSLSGRPRLGEDSELVFTVRRNGRPVEDLQPYLGAFGHLVSLRAGDLAYLHTHPVEHAEAGRTGGPEVRFGTTFPTSGSYRLFLDFRAGDAVHTAVFTVTVPEGGGPA